MLKWNHSDLVLKETPKVRVLPSRWTACIRATVAFIIISVVAVSVALFTTDVFLSNARFSLWTNLAFLVPIVMAVISRARAEVVILTGMFVVSCINHACLFDDVLRLSLGATSFVFAAVGLSIIAIATAVFLRRDVPPAKKQGIDAGDSCATISAVFIVLGAMITMIVLLATEADPCLYPSPTPSDILLLVPLWRFVDFSTATSALVVVIAIWLRVRPKKLAPVIWSAMLLTLVTRLYVYAGLMSSATSYIIIGIVIVLGVAIGVVTCINDQLPTFYVRDIIVAVGLGGLALYIFLFDNTETMHGWWHLLAAAALTLIIDSQREQD